MKRQTATIARGLRVAVVLSFLLGSAVVFLMPSAAAQGDPVRDFGRTNATLLLVVGVPMVLVAAFVPSVGQKNRTWLAIGGLVLVGVVVIAQMPIVGGGGAICDEDPNTVLPSCDTPPGVAWNVRIATTYDADVDVTAEVLDSEGATACDGGTPDLNGAIATLATNGIIDESKGLLTLESDMDQDLARTATAFHEIDCPLLPWSIALIGTIDANGDGTDDSVTWKARLKQMGPGTFSDGNQTSLPTIYYDPDFGWECAFLTEGNIWISAFGSDRYQTGSPPSSGPWVALGSHAGAGGAFDTGSFACVFWTTNGAPVGYTIPSAAGNVEWSATILVGSETNHRELRVDWKLQSRA